MQTQIKLSTHYSTVGWNKSWVTFLLALSSFSTCHAALLGDDFTVAIDKNKWTILSQSNFIYPCLTAGTSSNSSGTVMPACNFPTPDAEGSGALRLTPVKNDSAGAIVTSDLYPSNQGLQVTFTAYVWGGSKDGTAGIGADGISFFIQDGSAPTSIRKADGTTTANLDSYGGSLGYSCSPGKISSDYAGLTGGHLGLGIDEYGNFLNKDENTSTGISAQTSASTNGYNKWGSGTYQPNRIDLRGAGNVSWYWLNKKYSLFYSSTLSTSDRQTAVKKPVVQDICITRPRIQPPVLSYLITRQSRAVIGYCQKTSHLQSGVRPNVLMPPLLLANCKSRLRAI